MTGFMVVNVGVLRLSILETRKKIPEYISSYLTWYQVQTQKIEILHYIISYLSQLRFQKKFRPNESLGEALKEDLVKRTSLE